MFVLWMRPFQRLLPWVCLVVAMALVPSAAAAKPSSKRHGKPRSTPRRPVPTAPAKAAEDPAHPEGEASGTDEPADVAYPHLGGHVGLVLPLFVAGSPSGAIGSDFVSVGLAPALTVQLDRHWAMDFEIAVYADFEGNGSPGTFVLAPGGTYDFGPIAVGLRAAVAAGRLETQWGVVPLVRKAFPVGPVTLFGELDFPVLFRVGAATLTVQPHLGVMF